MKSKGILLCFILTAFIFQGWAEENRGFGGFKFSIRPNLYTYTDSGPGGAKEKSDIGLGFGLYYNYRLLKNLHLQIDGTYNFVRNTHRWNATHWITSGSSSKTIRMMILNPSIYFCLDMGQKLKLFFLAGGGIKFGSIEYFSTKSGSSSDDEFDFYYRFEAGLLFTGEKVDLVFSYLCQNFNPHIIENQIFGLNFGIKIKLI